MSEGDDEVHDLPIDGVLDLHTFAPGEVRDLVPEYLAACREAGVLAVRIIHGKGSGTLRALVRAALRRVPYVAAIRDGDLGSGGWGATLVDLVAQDGVAPGANGKDSVRGRKKE